MTGSNQRSKATTEPKRVLVTGATGQQGGTLARLLLDRGHHVRALTRKPDSDRAVALRKAGAEVVGGDLGDKSSVARAAKGVDASFLVATPYELGVDAETRFGKTGVDGMKEAGVPFVVYSSVSDADKDTGIPHFDSKAEVEEHLRASGMDFSIVAPVFFMENFEAPWVTGGLANGTLALGVDSDRRLQVISVPEIAQFTALAIESPRKFHERRINLASDDLTPVEMARILSELRSSRVTYYRVPSEQLHAQNEDLARMFDWFNRVGYSADIPKLKREYPEVHWQSFRDWATAQNWKSIIPDPPTS